MHQKNLICKNLFTPKKIAFTLAEVLITLAIIGVVAAMTLPTIIQNQQKRSLEVATQKFYSNMSQAIKKYMADEGVDDLRNTPLTDNLGTDGNFDKAQKACNDFVQKYLKVVKVCDYGCFADNYATQYGSISEYVGVKSEWKEYIGKYVLSDGAVVEVTPATDYVTTEYASRYPIDLYIDINGRKGPNKIGYDLWSMSIFYDGSIDEGGLTPECRKENKCLASSPTKQREERFDGCKNNNAYGGCFGHFLENGFKFDY